MISIDSLPCPICQQTRSSIVHTTSYPEHHYPGPFTMRRCDGCGLLFNSPRLDAKELAQLYGRNYYFFLRKADREFARVAAMYQRTVKPLEDQITDKCCVDIGCGRGFFPAILQKLGWNASGIEISPDAAQYARSKFGLEIFTGTIEQYVVSPNAKKFPLVTAIDVIEHVPSPDAFIAAAAKIVETGGWLIVDTPNGAARNIQNKGIAWKGFNPFHIYLFSIDNLTTLLRRHGMNVTQSFSYGNENTPITSRDRLIGTLKNFGLMGIAAQTYFAMKKLTIADGSIDPLIEKNISRIKSDSPYANSADNSGALAQDKTGDNIVVVARKD